MMIALSSDLDNNFSMRRTNIFPIIFLLVLLTACNTPPKPHAKQDTLIYALVSFSAEATKENGISGHRIGPAVDLKFEKQLGEGVGIGMEGGISDEETSI